MVHDDDSAASSDGSFAALLGALAHAPEHALQRPTSPRLAPGARVGRYVVAEWLGQGAMGAVYRARDEVLERDVALKLLHAGAPSAPVDRFRREVLALAAVSHENVVAVYDAGMAGEQPFLVLELVRGQTLRDRLRAAAFGPAAAAELAAQLARGLAAAHAVGVVHRDLKPENVLLDAGGRAKIVDFGLARLIEREDARDIGLTESGVLLGTAHYMAPEQVRGETADERADCFAFGALLYELLTGRRAFAGASRSEVIAAVLRDQPPADATLRADPRARKLLAIAFRCLCKQPEHRFRSAVEIIAALEDDGPAHEPAPANAGEGFEPPVTRYANAGGVHIAYQVVSPKGPPTLIAAPPFFSNIEVIWESPPARAWIEAMGSFSHFIHFDRRGVGMSDPIVLEHTLEDRAEDLRAVLDAEGVSRAFLLGVSEGAAISLAFAAKYPERARGVVVVNGFARLTRGDGYEHGAPREEYEWLIDKWVETWGTPKTLSLPLFVPSLAGDPVFTRWANRYERQCASPGTLRRLLQLQLEIDARPLLARARCPVLVLHRREERAVSVEHGRYLARNLPGATYVELEGIDHAPWHGDARGLLRLIEQFVAEHAR